MKHRISSDWTDCFIWFMSSLLVCLRLKIINFIRPDLYYTLILKIKLDCLLCLNFKFVKFYHIRLLVWFQLKLQILLNIDAVFFFVLKLKISSEVDAGFFKFQNIKSHQTWFQVSFWRSKIHQTLLLVLFEFQNIKYHRTWLLASLRFNKIIFIRLGC